jgi:hypothetical protein
MTVSVLDGEWHLGELLDARLREAPGEAPASG